MDLRIIRHTRLDIEPGRCYGQSEIALADSFDAELAALRARLPNTFDAVFSSPSRRCRQLSDAFANSIETDPRLLEYDFGDWEMQRWDDIDAAALNAWMQDFVNLNPPNGESLVDMFARVSKFMDHLRQRQYESCLLVTHAGVIRCIWVYLLSIPLGEVFKLEVGYGEVLQCRLARDPQEDIVYARA